ncbi:hypothetical protein MJD09_06130, partial [bacterium]|nr:hypothetical protein [bacterium]
EDSIAKSFLSTPAFEGGAQFSPNGKWLLYGSGESGAFEIYARPYPESSAGMWKISDGGGGYPLWSPDGKKIYYKSGNAMYSVDVTATDSFSKGNPEKIFEGNYFLPRQRGFDIHPGRRQIHHDSEAKCHSHGTANLYHSEFFGRTETAGARGQGLKRSENLPRIHSRQLG